MKYLNKLQQSLVEIFDVHEHAHIMGEDICAPYGGAFKVTKLVSEKYPERVMNTPICEASIVGMGTGMAIRGYPTIIEIMFGDFILIAADQIINEAAKFKAMFDNRLNVPIVIRTPMGAGRGYGPVHSQSLEKVFLGTPGLKVVAPSHHHDPGQALIASVESKSPVLFVEHKLLYPKEIIAGEIIGQDSGFDIVAVKNSQNNAPCDVVLLGYGGMSKIIEEAMAELAKEELQATALYPSLISSSNAETIAALMRHIPPRCPIVIVDEVEQDFGWSIQMAYSLIKAGISSRDVHIVSRDCEIIPTCYDLEQELIITPEKITQAVYSLLGIQ